MGNGIGLLSLPMGTRFHVINGAWWGRISGTPEERTVFVEATGETFLLDPDHARDLEIELEEEFIA